jgi:hypothetical protein
LEQKYSGRCSANELLQNNASFKLHILLMWRFVLVMFIPYQSIRQVEVATVRRVLAFQCRAEQYQLGRPWTALVTHSLRNTERNREQRVHFRNTYTHSFTKRQSFVPGCLLGYLGM